MTGVSEKQRRRKVFFFPAFKDWGRLTAMDRWRVCLIRLFTCISHNSFSFFIKSLLLNGWWKYISFLTQIHLYLLERAMSSNDPAEGWVRWRRWWTTVRLRTGGKHKLSNHHFHVLPKGLHLWNWWLNKSSHSESCNINTELKRKEGKKHWVMDHFLDAYT